MQKIFIFIIILFISCSETDTANVRATNSELISTDTINQPLQILLLDTSKYSILTKQSDVEFAFHKNCKIDTLNFADLQFIEKKLLHSIDSFNIEGKKRIDKRQKELGPSVKIDRNNFIIDTSKYKFQIISAMNDKNEREVWINAFCDDNKRNWRTEIIVTKDGGICYFTSVISLTKKRTIYFEVNDDV